VTPAAEDIARGELDATLIVGAEAARSARVAGDGAGGVRFRANAGDAAEGGEADTVVGGSEKGYVRRAEGVGGVLVEPRVGEGRAHVPDGGVPGARERARRACRPQLRRAARVRRGADG